MLFFVLFFAFHVNHTQSISRRFSLAVIGIVFIIIFLVIVWFCFYTFYFNWHIYLCNVLQLMYFWHMNQDNDRREINTLPSFRNGATQTNMFITNMKVNTVLFVATKKRFCFECGLLYRLGGMPKLYTRWSFNRRVSTWFTTKQFVVNNFILAFMQNSLDVFQSDRSDPDCSL